MKKSFLIFLIFLPLIFTSCSKKAELQPVNISKIEISQDNILFQNDPKSELLMIALRLIDFSPFSNSNFNNDDYVSGIDKMFEKQKNHEFVKYLKSNLKDFKSNYWILLKITDYISDDFTKINFTKKTIPEELKNTWGKIDPEKFITLFNDFAKVSNYGRIRILYEKQLKAYTYTTCDYFIKNEKILPYFFEYFYDSQMPEIIFNISPFMNFSFLNEFCFQQNNKDTITLFISPELNTDYYINNIFFFQNLSSSIIAGLIQKNYDQVQGFITSTAIDILKQNNIDEKYSIYDFISFISFYLAFFPTFNYVNNCMDPENASLATDYLNASFFSDNFLYFQKAFTLYEESRSEYKTFEAFCESYFFENYMKEQ